MNKFVFGLGLFVVGGIAGAQFTNAMRASQFIAERSDKAFISLAGAESCFDGTTCEASIKKGDSLFEISKGLDVTGVVTSSGAVTGASLGTAGAVTGATVDATGALTGGTIASDASVSATTTLSAGSTLKLNTAAGNEPTCNEAARGTIHYKPGGAGAADLVEICSKNTSNAYAWRDLATPES